MEEKYRQFTHFTNIYVRHKGDIKTPTKPKTISKIISIGLWAGGAIAYALMDNSLSKKNPHHMNIQKLHT